MVNATELPPVTFIATTLGISAISTHDVRREITWMEMPCVQPAGIKRYCQVGGLAHKFVHLENVFFRPGVILHRMSKRGMSAADLFDMTQHFDILLDRVLHNAYGTVHFAFGFIADYLHELFPFLECHAAYLGRSHH